MTKKELIDMMADYPDDAYVVIEVHDTCLCEDLYAFTFDAISWTKFEPRRQTEMHELRLTPINHKESKDNF